MFPENCFHIIYQNKLHNFHEKLHLSNVLEKGRIYYELLKLLPRKKFNILIEMKITFPMKQTKSVKLDSRSRKNISLREIT